MPQPKVDYSLYLVTDSTPAILGNKDLVKVVEAAVAGGVTLVQLRDKTSDTGDLIRIAEALHEVTRAANVPLLVNDRIDVALGAGVEGVHIGQDDMDYETARKLLGSDAIIGVTANTEAEALQAAHDGADYLGVGTVFSTATKANTKSIIGTAGVQHILSLLASQNLGHVKTVCIGGINAKNAQRVLYQTASPAKSLDGIAVVSAIMAASDPGAAAKHLKDLVSMPPPFAKSLSKHPLTRESIISTTPSIIARLASTKPLAHNMTNLVVQHFAASVALAIGASPIMSNNGLEAADLAALGGSLVINMGTTTPEIRKNHLLALEAYNAVGGPVVFDPVGAGATAARREGTKALMPGGGFSV
ncbi:thiamine biosynthetic bifunctional enzyme, partial [Oleoguttula sp. CCFEE 5521]